MATFQVTASTDDCYERLNTTFFDLTATAVQAGKSTATNRWGSGMRFLGITIAGGSTIDSAYLTLRASIDRAVTVCNTRISAEDVDDAITFANDSAAFETRYAARTTARVDWDAIAAWTADTDYDSPEIKTVIQEIIDRGSWASGNDIVIFWEDFDDRSDGSAVRSAYSEDGTGEAPKLVITYTEPAATRGWMRGLVHGGRRHRFSGRR